MEQQAQYMRDGLRLTEVSASAAKLAADTAKRALETTERADVMIETAASPDAPNITAGNPITIVFRNFGRTRAQDVAVDGSLWLATENGSRVALLVKAAIPAVIGPKGIHTMALKPTGAFLTGEEIVRVNDGSATLSLYVTIKYQDPFGTHSINADGIFRAGRCTMTHTDID